MINFDKEIREIDIAIKKGVDNAVEYLKTKIDEKTPEDTFELIKNNKIEKASRNGNKITGKVYNETPYAEYVEYGVRQADYNYYKDSGRRKGLAPFYTGIGARMFTRSADEEEQTLNNIIAKEL